MSEQVKGKRVRQQFSIKSAVRIGAAYLVAQFESQVVKQRIIEIESRKQLSPGWITIVYGGSSLGDKLPVESQNGIRPCRVLGPYEFAIPWNELQRLRTNLVVDPGSIAEAQTSTRGPF